MSSDLPNLYAASCSIKTFLLYVQSNPYSMQILTYQSIYIWILGFPKNFLLKQHLRLTWDWLGLKEVQGTRIPALGKHISLPRIYLNFLNLKMKKKNIKKDKQLENKPAPISTNL